MWRQDDARTRHCARVAAVGVCVGARAEQDSYHDTPPPVRRVGDPALANDAGLLMHTAHTLVAPRAPLSHQPLRSDPHVSLRARNPAHAHTCACGGDFATTPTPGARPPAPPAAPAAPAMSKHLSARALHQLHHDIGVEVSSKLARGADGRWLSGTCTERSAKLGEGRLSPASHTWPGLQAAWPRQRGNSFG